MYTRYCSYKGYKVEVVDILDGDEAGIKRVSFLVTGFNAYGYLKCEKGVHRLVRLSPFDCNNKRHTSFASVDLIPEIDSSIDIEIKDEELKIDVTQMILKKVEKTGFVTSLEFEELLDWGFCKRLINTNRSIDAWGEYDRGKKISYVWFKDNLS